MGSMNTSQKKT